MIAAPADALVTAASTISSQLVGRWGVSSADVTLPVIAAVITRGGVMLMRAAGVRYHNLPN
jgi:hypothetical protein